MAKKAIYYEDAKRLYVFEGFSLDTVCELLKGNVSRKTLYNWKEAHGWDEKRKKHVESSENIAVDLQELVKKSIFQYQADPTAHNMFAVHKAITSLKIWQGVKPLEGEEEPKDKRIKASTIEQIEKEILGLE
jgi:hypothetical protein